MGRRTDTDVRADIEAHHNATYGRINPECWAWGADSAGGNTGRKETCDGCGRQSTPMWFDGDVLCWRCAYTAHLPACPYRNDL